MRDNLGVVEVQCLRGPNKALSQQPTFTHPWESEPQAVLFLPASTDNAFPREAPSQPWPNWASIFGTPQPNSHYISERLFLMGLRLLLSFGGRGVFQLLKSCSLSPSHPRSANFFYISIPATHLYLTSLVQQNCKDRSSKSSSK